MQFDYIIIGSGSAGSTLAYRLGENKKYSILVLEYGGSDAGPLIQMPAALSYPMNMKNYDWGYYTEPEDMLDGRSLACPRGKVIGGSSSINGMIYVRGHSSDFDNWAEIGASGWSYADVLPYFKRMENSQISSSEWRGNDGPLNVTRGPRNNPLHVAFVNATSQAGYAQTEDYNGYRQEGFGAADMTVWKGRRWSTANAYLRPALKRGNVKLVKGALVDKILFHDNKAIAVIYHKLGQKITVSANAEIILAAGSINSPQILQRSGIGKTKILKSAGIKPLIDLPGVGANLQDHLEVYFQQECLQQITLNRYLNPVSKALIGAQWLLFKSGIGASNQFETLGFIRSQAGIPYPDIQFHFLPAAIRYDGKTASAKNGFQLHVGPMRSLSRGYVNIISSDPKIVPKIKFNYMSHPEDWVIFRNCIKLSREILNMPAMAPFKGTEIAPGEKCTSDAEIDNFIRQNAESAYHPCGTMRMGNKKDPMTVVDSECKVRFVERLRVADSSIFPSITNGNLNAPTIMVAEKASDHILGRGMLSPSNLKGFIHPEWQNSQR